MAEFERVDRTSAFAAIDAALAAGVRHFVYVSVAQPAPVMQTYIAIRAGIESRLREVHAQAGLRVSILRPWYVLGPGHRWPYMLLPFYALARMLAPTRETAQRLGLVTLREMVAALVYAIEHPPRGVALIDVPGIRALARCVAADGPIASPREGTQVWP